MLKLKNK